MNEPTCACFQYVGDNPYCPIHGKQKEKDRPIVRISSACGKMIATLERPSATRVAEAADAGWMPAQPVVEDE